MIELLYILKTPYVLNLLPQNNCPCTKKILKLITKILKNNSNKLCCILMPTTQVRPSINVIEKLNIIVTNTEISAIITNIITWIRYHTDKCYAHTLSEWVKIHKTMWTEKLIKSHYHSTLVIKHETITLIQIKREVCWFGQSKKQIWTKQEAAACPFQH